MSMEQRVSALEDASALIISATRALNESVQRLEATVELHERMRQQELSELAEAIRRSDEAVQALQAFVPITQAEVVRLDNRIDSIEGA